MMGCGTAGASLDACFSATTSVSVLNSFPGTLANTSWLCLVETMRSPSWRSAAALGLVDWPAGSLDMVDFVAILSAAATGIFVSALTACCAPVPAAALRAESFLAMSDFGSALRTDSLATDDDFDCMGAAARGASVRSSSRIAGLNSGPDVRGL